MMLERKSQIENLKREFPNLRSWGFRPVLFTLPISGFFGDSSCLLEITIPRKYPKQRVSFKLLNPIPHKWSKFDAIECPDSLYGKPIVDAIWAIVSNFNDYEKYCRGNAVELKISKEQPKMGILEQYGKGTDPKNEIHENILKAINSPPKGPIRRIINATDNEIDHMLKSDDAIRTIIYNTDEINDVLIQVKRTLLKNEEAVNNILQSLNKRESLTASVRETIDLIKKTGYSNINNSIASKSGIIDKIQAEVEKLSVQVSENEKMIESGHLHYENTRDRLLELRGKINRLSVLHISISNSC